MALSSFEPYAQQRSVPPHGMANEDDDLWHVKVASDDVKLMTLEQLDDAYRLSIIDGETSVWKRGMREWRPLSVVAGLEEDADVGDAAPKPAAVRSGLQEKPSAWSLAGAMPTQPPPRPSAPPRSTSSVPARAMPAAAPPPPVRSYPPPPRLNITHPPPAPASRPAPPYSSLDSLAASRRLPDPEPAAPPVAAAAPATAHVQTVLPPSPETWNSVSTPPLAQSVAPHGSRSKRAERLGGALLVLAVLGGTSVSLYRNDLLLTVAQKAHVEHQFLQAEQRYLGGPSFGMLRSLAPGAEQSPAEAAATPLRPGAPSNATIPTASPTPAAPEPAAPPAPATAGSTPSPAASQPDAPLPRTPAATPAPVAGRRHATSRVVASTAKPDKQKASGSPSGGPAAVHLDEEPEAPKSKASAPAAKAEAAAPAGPALSLDDAIREAVKRKSPKKAKPAGDEHDPLNPNL